MFSFLQLPAGRQPDCVYICKVKEYAGVTCFTVLRFNVAQTNDQTGPESKKENQTINVEDGGGTVEVSRS
jgi:hypothetical protein